MCHPLILCHSSPSFSSSPLLCIVPLFLSQPKEKREEAQWKQAGGQKQVSPANLQPEATALVGLDRPALLGSRNGEGEVRGRIVPPISSLPPPRHMPSRWGQVVPFWKPLQNLELILCSLILSSGSCQAFFCCCCGRDETHY